MNTKASWKPDWRSSNGHYRDAWEIAFLLLFLVKEWDDNICMLKTIIASSYMDVFISCIIKIKPISFLYFTVLWHPQIKSSCVLSCSVVSDSCHPIDCSPARLLCPWDSPCKSTGVGRHFLLQGIFPPQELNPGPLHCRQTRLTELRGKP